MKITHKTLKDIKVGEMYVTNISGETFLRKIAGEEPECYLIETFDNDQQKFVPYKKMWKTKEVAAKRLQETGSRQINLDMDKKMYVISE